MQTDAVIAVALELISGGQKLLHLYQQRRSEGKDVSSADLEKLANEDDSASLSLQRLIESKKSEGK